MDHPRRRRRAELPEHVSRNPARREKGRETMRWAILSASVLALGVAAGSAAFPAMAASAPAAASSATPATPERDPAALLRTTSPPNAVANRTYADPSAALMAADVDYLVREARRELAQGDRTP